MTEQAVRTARRRVLCQHNIKANSDTWHCENCGEQGITEPWLVLDWISSLKTSANTWESQARYFMKDRDTWADRAEAAEASLASQVDAYEKLKNEKDHSASLLRGDPSAAVSTEALPNKP